MGLIAHGLAELQPRVLAAELDRLGPLLNEDQLFLLRETDDHGRAHLKLIERLQGGVKLSQPAINQNHIRVQFTPLPRFPIPTTDDLANRHIVIAPGNALYLVASVAILIWPAVDEADFRADGLATLEMGDVNRFQAADRRVDAQDFLQRRQPLPRVGREDRHLGLPFHVAHLLLSLIKLFDGLDLIAQGCRPLVILTTR